MKSARRNLKKVIDIVIGLKQNTENTVCLRPFFFCNTVGNFFLQHAHDLIDLVTTLHHLKKNLRRNVVWEIADDRKFRRKDFTKIEFEKMAADDPSFKRYKMFFQIGHRVAINLDNFKIDILPLHEVLCEHPHTRTDL